MSRKLFFPHMNIFLEVEEPKLTTSVSLERFIHCNEKPMHCNEQQPPLTATREKPDQQQRPSTARNK